jgi:hypothetical protein
LRTPYRLVTEEGILFVHFREMPGEPELPLIKSELTALALKDGGPNSILATLPVGFASVMSHLNRYGFETAVIDGGGQLAFVAYDCHGGDPAVDYAALDEAEYRAGIIRGLRQW